MVIIGERINSTRKSIAQAIEERNVEFIQQEARMQVKAGAQYIDLNAGAFFEQEIEYLPWLVEIVSEVIDKPLCLDTNNASALAAALDIYRGKAIVNSITAEKKRYDAFLPIIRQYGCGVSALCIGDSGIPAEVEGRVKVACSLIERLVADNVDLQDIYIDPLVQPLGVDNKAAIKVVKTLQQVKAAHPDVNTILGLSNISYGLPIRRQLNHIFMVMVLQAGLDAAIIDPCDNKMMACIITSNALLGQDADCLRYIKAYRNGILL